LVYNLFRFNSLDSRFRKRWDSRDRAASFDGADGVVLAKEFLDQHHPVCAADEASPLFLIAQPPLLC
jgi:hypothetical protein